jgi:RNA polymerase-binding transcription factor DksA
MAFDPDEARALIQAERERLERLAAAGREELELDADAFDSELSDVDNHPADQASEHVEQQRDQAVLQQVEAELAELEAALARVEAGTYGIDEVTGEEIDPERLRALPAARTNVGSAPERRGAPEAARPSAGDPGP